MATADEIRTDIAAAREELKSALSEAGANWERAPGSGEGEAAWSAREAAQHVVGAEFFFAGAVCKACGYPGPERPYEGNQPELLDAAAAAAMFDDAVAAADAKIKHVTDSDLAKPRNDDQTVEDFMAFWPLHLRDHAEQIRSATKG